MVTKLKAIFLAQAETTSSIPLSIFRFIFGIIMAISATRFVAKGWIESLYIAPSYHFKYFGFEWVTVPESTILYLMFSLLIASSLMIALGLFYRISTIVFCLIFTYVQLMDKALYLNHYYFISIIAFLLIFIPAHRFLSLDSLIFRKIKSDKVVQLFPNLLKVQIGLVYFFAGIAKVNHDWLIDAMPLRIWLQAKVDFPVIGYFFQFEWTAYAMSWAGCLYDLLIPFLLLNSKTRKPAFVVLVIFHLLTWFMFNIGMFPWIMMLGATIFFSAEEFQKVFPFLKKTTYVIVEQKKALHPVFKVAIGLFLLTQILIPLRVHWMGGNSWNEAGYRYSWNVMRVEKAGYAEFRCYDPITKQGWTVFPNKELAVFQVKQMSFQPDMILEYAHHLEAIAEKDIEVYADVWVTINGKLSRRFIDPAVDLTTQNKCGFCSFDWVLD